MIQKFLETYKDGHEVFLNDSERDEIVEEIERLKGLCDRYEEEHRTTFEEWKKDINIINEFDKFLFGELQNYGGGGIVQEYYDKLQELKGSGKE